MRSQLTAIASEWTLRQCDGHEYTFRVGAGETVLIGRDPQLDIPVVDAGVSRRHARLRFDGEDLWLEDLQSQNGTYINAERIDEHRLCSGDVITLGGVSFVLFEQTDAREALAARPPLADLSKPDLVDLVHVARQLTVTPMSAARRVLELAQRAVPSRHAGVFLWDESRSLLYPLAALPENCFHERQAPLTTSLARAVLLEVNAHILSGRSGVAVPLVAPTRPLGILYLEECSRAHLTSDRIHFLESLAWLAAPTLDGLSTSSLAPSLTPTAKTANLKPEQLPVR